MCKTRHELQCKRADVSAKLHAEITPATSRLLMIEFQEACQRIEDHEKDCQTCKVELRVMA